MPMLGDSQRQIDRTAASSYETVSKWLLWPFASSKRFRQIAIVGAFVLGGIVGTVLVVNRHAESISSAAETLPPVPSPPSVIPMTPTGLSGTATSTSAIKLSWSANTDMEILKYIVYRGGSKLGEVSSGTSYEDTGLSANTSYTYAVSAVSTFNFEGGKSADVTVKTLDNTPAPVEDTTPPSVPTNLSVSTVSSSEINLTWTASTDDTGVSGYTIYRCEGRNCTPTVPIGTATTATYSDTGLSAKTSYVYRVKAADEAGNTSDYSSSAKGSTSNAGGGGGNGGGKPNH